MKYATLLLLCLLGATGAQAEASLKDKPQLLLALAEAAPCCVIDGRVAANRTSAPLKDALLWRADLQINPTATVIVIADRDDDALAIGNTLSVRYPGKTILAVRGGLATWKAVTLSLLTGAGMDTAFGGPVSFVIPANTCEQGKPLQELRPDKK